MNTVREHIYLAALLHDIGKFYQRADSGSVATSEMLTPIVRGLESIILPSYKGVKTHKHCLWTAQFLDDYQSVFQKMSVNTLGDLTNKDNLINLSAGHHLSFDQQTELGKSSKRPTIYLPVWIVIVMKLIKTIKMRIAGILLKRNG